MITNPFTTTTAATARRRARLSLAGIGLAAILLLAAALVAGLVVFSGHRQPSPTPPGPTPPLPSSGREGRPGWDWAGEAALATRPMLVLPAQAAGPQPLATRPAPGGVRLPSPSGDLAGIPAGFPQTPAGAVAALSALTTQGLRGADPQTYIRVYQALASPGAPPPGRARLAGLLTSLRSSAGIPPTGPVAGLTMSWLPEQALIKGVLDGGRYVVACVLGQFTADYQGRLITYGVGDCQALRWIASDPTTGASGQWLISPGPPAAEATDAWPGSQDSVTAGYQEIVQ
jgi:hypothetical protein